MESTKQEILILTDFPQKNLEILSIREKNLLQTFLGKNDWQPVYKAIFPKSVGRNDIGTIFAGSEDQKKKLRNPKPAAKQAKQDALNYLKTNKYKYVLALGKFSLWCLRNEFSISSWRGHGEIIQGSLTVFSYHPREVLKNGNLQSDFYQDVARFKKYIDREETLRDTRKFIIPSSVDEVKNCLESLGEFVAVDVETRGVKVKIPPRKVKGKIVDTTIKHRHIDCIGFADSKSSGFCIPLRRLGGEPYWSLEQAASFFPVMFDVLKTRKIIGQNFSYDGWYFAHDFGVVPNLVEDTLFIQHAIHPSGKKDLGYLSSIYCDTHEYWKT